MSPPDDDLAALRRAFAAIPAVAPDPEACPPAERFLAAVRGELPPAELSDLVEHVAACPACAEDWRLALALEQPEAAAPERAYAPPAIPSLRRFPRAVAWWAPAAAAAAVLLFAVLLPRLPSRSTALRGAKEGPKLLSPEVLSRESPVLRWSEVRGATSYDLDVHTGTGQSVERATRLAETQYRIPPDHLTAIPAGTELTWRVTANLPNDKHLSSFLGHFVLR